MDMRKYLKPYLSLAELKALGGDYEGVIEKVTEETLHNRYKGQSSDEGVISFLDGKRLVLNKDLLRKCISWFGANSDDWAGRRLRVFVRTVEMVNKKTGKVTIKEQRGIVCEDAHARSVIIRAPEPVASLSSRDPNDDDAESLEVTQIDEGEVADPPVVFGKRPAH